MIRTLGVALVASLALSACGTVSSASALHTWATQSQYVSNSKILVGDAEHSAKALMRRSTSSAALHTVCGVLYFDTESANASLPTPDTLATNLLSRAYGNLGAGASECYAAASSALARTHALHSLAAGLFDLSEASARIASASTP